MLNPTVVSPFVSSTLDRTVVQRLQSHQSEPSVSVLLPTTPAATLATHDVLRLHRLLARAHQRLQEEGGVDRAPPLMQALRELAVLARRLPARRGLALFASEEHAEAVQLPVAVQERVVIDPTFATRDLVHSLLSSPRFRLLVLARGSSRLLEGARHRLQEVHDDGFPLVASRITRGRASLFGRDRSDQRDSEMLAHIRSVDVGLARRRLREPLPLVIAGVSRQRSMFRSRATEAEAVIGEITGSHERATPARLALLAGPVIDAHLARRGDAVLARLDEGRRRGRTVAGIAAVWKAAAQGRVGLLCVEQGFKLPARLTGTNRIRPASEPEGAGVLDDSIDELIELVLARGAEVALVDDGRLAAHDRVAALVS